MTKKLTCDWLGMIRLSLMALSSPNAETRELAEGQLNAIGHYLDQKGIPTPWDLDDASSEYLFTKVDAAIMDQSKKVDGE